ncbi:hypothetical protein [Celeribacter indicus]|uniref:Uncharacterized protein n=1 Tax=Celeribacter indicus TaxID=1208324 RepID=A0A0B5E4G7_9RHOB|nr:hypothetical protein [Celeribacter indicus]AJE48255.1 hypothetical protein P73_3540 [Celeribacter indicus]SDW70812.1 hypothetical protein SAMN05443573_10683 [Celeribacter indicus]
MFKVLFTLAAASLSALPALAAGTQPYAPGVTVFAYPAAENFCPAGTQPVRHDGAISCGTANATGYGEPAARAARRPAYAAPVTYTDPKSPHYMPDRIEMGAD